MPHQTTIRTIEARDNAALAKIIRQTLEEFKANREGTVYYDPTTDNLYQLFSAVKSVYYVVDEEGKILGGAGVFPTDGLGNATCELVKMYLLPEARGKGLAAELLQLCLQFAKQAGYKNMYLETMPELVRAIPLYEKNGFERLSTPLGQSGHFGCGIWMMKEL